jgi:hypothetical protein
LVAGQYDGPNGPAWYRVGGDMLLRPLLQALGYTD